MKCDNKYCIYNDDGECMSDEIEINDIGFCIYCMYPDIPEDYLEKMKKELRDELDRRDEELEKMM